MLKFADMTQSQRLFVVDPEFRDFMTRCFPAFAYPYQRERLVREAYVDGWLEDQVMEYFCELGITSPERGLTSFALDSVLAFNIGRLNAWYRANELSYSEEGYLISSKEHDEYLSLLVSWSEIVEWAKVVYGLKGLVNNTRA